MTGWVVWVLVAAAPGDQKIDVAVEYSAPEACPPRARFEAELRARSDKLRLVESGGQATVSLGIVEQKKRFVGTTKVRTTLSGVTTREFKSARCETLVQAAALATSLLLDPEGTRMGEVTVSLTPPVDAGVELPVVDAGAMVVEPVVDAGVLVVDAGPPVVVEAPRVDAGVPVVADAGAPSPVSLELAAGGGFTAGISGALDGLVQVTVALQWSRFRLALSPQLVPGRRVTNENGVAVYLGAGGRLDALLSFPVGSWLRVEGGAQLSVMFVPVSAPLAEIPGRALGVLVAPGPFARVVLLVGSLRVAIEGGAGVNVRAERYVISGAGPVFVAPRPFGLLGGSVGWAF